MRISLRYVVLGVLFCTVAKAAETIDADHRVRWLAGVTDGVYSDPANWTGGEVPADGSDGKYGYIPLGTSDITVRAPAGGLVENSGTIFEMASSGTHTLTIDTRGSFWEKGGVKSANDWWCAPFAGNLSGSHIFNFESCDKVANSNLVWRFDDALFTWRNNGWAQQDFDLVSGTFMIGKPLYLGSVGGRISFNIHAGATLACTNSGALRQRGNFPTVTTFWGGAHALSGVSLKDQNSSRGTTWLVLTNDTALTVGNEGVLLGCKSGLDKTGYSTGVVDLFGTSALTVLGETVLGAGNAAYYNLCNAGVLTLHDQSVYAAKGHAYIGRMQSSTGTLTVADHAFFRLDDYRNLFLACASNAVGRIDVSGDGKVYCGGILRPGAGIQSSGVVSLRDRAQVQVSPVAGNWLTLGSNADASYGRVELTDDAVLELDYRASVEMTMGGTARAELALAGNARLLGGSRSFITNKSEVVGNTSVALADAASLRVVAVYGGKPGTGEPRMSFLADGGTLAPASAPSVPFLSGCVATLGARGLTLDTAAYDLVVDQAFTAADGADAATVTKTGSGALVVRRNSDHPQTVVSNGRLVFGAGVTRFGRTLHFGPSGALAFSDGVSADALVLDGTLGLFIPSDLPLDESRTLLSVAQGLTDEQLAHIYVANTEAGKNYALARSGDGTGLSVTVTAATAGDLVWTGAASSDWNTADNWMPARVPTHNDRVTVGAGATLALSACGNVGNLVVDGTAAVTVSGLGMLAVADGVTVPEGASLTLAAPLVCATGSIRKDGSGLLTVSGPGGAMTGGWTLPRGVTAFTSAAALSAAVPATAGLVLSNDTFRYEGAATAISRGVTLAGELPAAFDIRGDLAFTDFHLDIKQGDNGILKLGEGTLTLDLPSGRTVLSKFANAVRKGNSDPLGLYVPTNGETTDWNGLGQLTVLGGRLVLQGRGRNVTDVRQEHHALLGGSGVSATVAPELYVKDCTFTQGSGYGFHFLVDQQVVAGSPGSRLVLDNADVECNGLYLGFNKISGNGDVIHPVLAITNGTLKINWLGAFPSDVGGIEPIIRVGAGGRILRQSITAAGGLTFTRKIDARFEDGGSLVVAAPQNVYFGGTASGEMTFARGGTLVANQIIGRRNATDSGADIVLDSGSAEFTLDGGVSYVGCSSVAGFRIDAGGGEVKVDGAKTHTLAIPFRGAGALVKTGTGTLVLTNDLKWVNDTTFVRAATTTVMLQNEGGLRIDAGTVVCAPGTTDAGSRFSGAGVLAASAFNTLTLPVDPESEDATALTLRDVTAERYAVDFGRVADDQTIRSGSSFPVARLAGATAFSAAQWKGRNAGLQRVVTFTCADGLVSAKVSSSGFIAILR